jgi:hypothetical protein
MKLPALAKTDSEFYKYLQENNKILKIDSNAANNGNNDEENNEIMRQRQKKDNNIACADY